MIVLGIETSCDETSLALVEDGKKILGHVIHSQIEIHRKYGGVYPEIASREHFSRLLPLYEALLKNTRLSSSDIDGIAVAHRPGLMGSLLMGTTFAKTLARILEVPLVGVHHLEAHLYAALMESESFPAFPALGVILSGGHTALLHIHDIGSYTVLAKTLDDAIGESLDKVARLLDLPYPGGPEIEKMAIKGKVDPSLFPIPKIKNNHDDFSFSGLKTKARHLIQKQPHRTYEEKANIAASYQDTVFRYVVRRIERQMHKHRFSSLVVGGGVVCNTTLQQHLSRLSYPLYYPSPQLCVDNGAMIAGLGYHQIKKESPEKKNFSLSITPTNNRLFF